jgi:hypothetical protein
VVARSGVVERAVAARLAGGGDLKFAPAGKSGCYIFGIKSKQKVTQNLYTFPTHLKQPFCGDLFQKRTEKPFFSFEKT